MTNDIRFSYIKECEKEFKELLEIDNFPKYDVQYKELTMEKSEKEGFDSFATAYYDIPTGKHILEIWSNLYTLGEAGKQVVFHELTHMLDDEMYVDRDKIKYLSNHGFTEYHASQIEFLKLLSVSSTSKGTSFSINETIDTVSGKKSIKEFVEAPHAHATELINRADFPANIETLKVTLGIIFNYYGRRSICKMYAVDYEDSADNSTIAKLITTPMVTFLNTYMTGWFDKARIDVLGNIYKTMILSLVKQYKLS